MTFIPAMSTIIKGRYLKKTKDGDKMPEGISLLNEDFREKLTTQLADKISNEILIRFSPDDALQIIKKVKKNIKQENGVISGWHIQS